MYMSKSPNDIVCILVVVRLNRWSISMYVCPIGKNNTNTSANTFTLKRLSKYANMNLFLFSRV